MLPTILEATSNVTWLPDARSIIVYHAHLSSPLIIIDRQRFSLIPTCIPREYLPRHADGLFTTTRVTRDVNRDPTDRLMNVDRTYSDVQKQYEMLGEQHGDQDKQRRRAQGIQPEIIRTGSWRERGGTDKLAGNI